MITKAWFLKKKFQYYVCYLIARLKTKVRKTQKHKEHAQQEKDDIYALGYLMALYDVIDDMTVFAADFDIDMREIGLDCNIKEILENFLKNLSYISDSSYQKRVQFKESEQHDGEFDQLNDLLIDQCEILNAQGTFDKNRTALLSRFYRHLEPFFQDHDTLSKSQKEKSWKEIVGIANAILATFSSTSDHRPEPEASLLTSIHLTKKECEYIEKAEFIPKRLKTMVVKKIDGEKPFFEGSLTWVDEMRNLFHIQSQVLGFHTDSNQTSERNLLETLEDKFYLPEHKFTQQSLSADERLDRASKNRGKQCSRKTTD